MVGDLRGDDGAQTGGLAVDSNLGWKGAESYVATVPQVFIDGEFIGGCDIVRELHASGELKETLAAKSA